MPRDPSFAFALGAYGGNGGRPNRSHHRPVAAAVMLALFTILSCGEDATVDTGRVGTPCTTCDECSTFITSCSCDECVRFAYDADTKTLLKCVEGLFQVVGCCPGGGSATCKDGVRSETCFPLPGDEIPRGSCDKYRCGC